MVLSRARGKIGTIDQRSYKSSNQPAVMTTATSCRYQRSNVASNQVAITNQNGFYNSSLVLTNPNTVIILETYSNFCNEGYSQTFTVVNGQNQYEANFIICAQNYDPCQIGFYYYYQMDGELTFSGYASDSLSFNNWTWDFGDGTTGTGMQINHNFEFQGNYVVTVSATSNICGTVSYSEVVSLYNNIDSGCYANFYYDWNPNNANGVNFYDASWTNEPIISWAWDFGDGETSNEINPIHNYFEIGDYLVTLTIETENCSSTIQNVVFIGDTIWYPITCQAFFSNYYDYENYKISYFEDWSWAGENDQIIGWSWDFGDSTFSNLPNPTHEYAEDGEYFVTLTIYTNNCSSSFTSIVYIQNNPWGNCSTLFFPEFQENLNVQFYDMTYPTPTEYLWDFGDNTTSTEANPLHQFSEEGYYIVTLYTAIISADSNTTSACFSAYQMELLVGYETSKLVSQIISASTIYTDGTPFPIDEKIQPQNIITVYPNPVVDILNINLNSESENTIVNIYTTSGQLITQQEFNENNISINTQNLPEGVYILKINSDGNISTSKFVK